MQMLNRKKKNRLKNRFGRVLGSIWEGFGAVWGLFGAFLTLFSQFFGRSKSIIFRAWAQDGLQEAFWMDFGWILIGFGGLWERFGKVLAGFWLEFGIWPSFAQILSAFGKTWPCCSKASKLDPRADPRSVTIQSRF